MKLQTALEVDVGCGVVIHKKPHVVRTVVIAHDDVDTWLEWRLESPEGECWLSLEEVGGQPRICRWQRHRGPAPEPFQPKIPRRGDFLKLTEHGSAHFEARGTDTLPASGTIEYAVYQGESRALAFERYEPGANWWIGEGAPIPAGAVARRSHT